MRTIARGGVIAVVVMGLLVASASALAGTRYGTRTLRKGTTGSDVKTAQRYLTRAGFRTTADGQFGSGTVKKVKSFERKFKQKKDGKLTVKEQRRLKTIATKASTDTSATSAGGSSLDDPMPTGTVPGSKATINPDGTANAPADAPPAIKKLIAAGNEIAHTPYKYGGGHASFKDSGYDCSGSVSYVLHAAGLLKTPRDSTGLESWGTSGRGKWLSVYANAGHTYIRVAGLRFDTSGMRADDGSRWHTSTRSASGYVIRHARGL